MKKLWIVALLSLLCLSAGAQVKQKDFKECCDSLTAQARRRFGVKGSVALTKVKSKDNKIDLYFDRSFSDFPWKSEDLKWFRAKLREFWPKTYKSYSAGTIFCQDAEIEDLITPSIENSGKSAGYKYSYTEHTTNPCFVRPAGESKYQKGMANRVIALWQSHGLFYDAGEGRWNWQRSPNWRTVEDLYTQSYVLPFLIPMLENAGAYVLTPRERDTNIYEIICDNDPAYSGSTSKEKSDWAENFSEALPERTHGKYSEKGSWSSAGTGFADAKQYYNYGENPFTMGTARQSDGAASARWTPDIPERGTYAVYISYKKVEGSTKSAKYTVNYLGGKSQFIVNQNVGSGTWIYLGSFEFDKGTKGYVSVENGGEGVLTADAVKFGGGIGKVARDGVVSGMPAYTEGALYWMQWAGADKSLFEKWDGDYTKDFAGRGAWVKWMKNGLKVPFDLSLAFHSDAGVTPNDSTIGTLAIYTLKADDSRKFTNGKDRMACRLLGDMIQTQVVNDIRADFDADWTRRGLWDRSYSESRTTDVPGIILELLSHQNFSDMKFGHDPRFKFTVSRAVYKGMLKFLSSWYGTSYVVQPLPVGNFSAIFAADSAKLSWKPISDAKEPTATPEGYIVYTKIDDGGWDSGVEVRRPQYAVPIEQGHIYSYKVQAFNKGGKSFPSEVLSLGKASDKAKKVLVINNFDRMSAPSWFDSEAYGGFDDEMDSGVPYMSDITMIGENYEYRRNREYVSNYSPGFGGSYYNFAGHKYAGNTYDYPYLHGKALMDLGYSFSSQSSRAFCAAPDTSAFALDIICGKQISTVTGRADGPVHFQVFPAALQKQLKTLSVKGMHILISGANIASDAWDEVYPFDGDARRIQSSYQRNAQNFVQNYLGYKWVTSRGCPDGVLQSGSKIFNLYNEKNETRYCVENPDGIRLAVKKGKAVLKYPATNTSAGVVADMGNYRVAAFGFPLECLKDNADMKYLIRYSMDYFKEAPAPKKDTPSKSSKGKKRK